MKLLIAILTIISHFAFAQSSNVNLDDIKGSEQVDQLYKACQNTTAIWNEVKPVQAVPAVIGFEGGRTSLGDLCYQVTQIHNHVAKLKSLAAKISSQGLTKEGAAAKLAFTGLAYTQNQSTLDEKENKTPAAIAKSRSKRKYGNFYKKITGISKVEADSDPEKNERLLKYEGDYDRLANIDRKRSALESKLHCKEGVNEDIKARFQNELSPLQEKQEILSEKKDFYYQELITLSSKFRRERDMEGFVTELKEVDRTAILLLPADIEKEVDAAEYYNATDGSKKLRPIKKAITIQSFTVLRKAQLITDFQNKWDKNWRDSIADNLDSVLEALDDGTSCSSAVVRKRQGGNLEQVAEYGNLALSRCKARKSFNQKSAGDYFSTNFKLYLLNYNDLKDTEAKMLTLESELLRERIAPTKNELKLAVKTDSDPCMSELTASDMAALNKKLVATEGEYKLMAVEARMKKEAINQRRYDERVKNETDMKRMQDARDQEREQERRNMEKMPKSLAY